MIPTSILVALSLMIATYILGLMMTVGLLINSIREKNIKLITIMLTILAFYIAFGIALL